MQSILPRVLMLNVAGHPLRWISYKESATYYAKDKVVWFGGAEEFMLRGGTNTVSGIRSTLHINTIIAVAGKISDKAIDRQTTIALTNVSLFARDRNICGYCSRQFPSSKLTRDHVIPKSRGGENTWTNCVSACGRCNKIKDDRLLHEIDMELQYVPYKPSLAEFLILANRKILASQMDFLIKHVPEESPLHRAYAS